MASQRERERFLEELEQVLGLDIEEQETPRPQPQTGPQTIFYETEADIAIFGGAAGGGKTFALLLDFARHVDNPQYGGVIFRRTCPQITNEGGLWDTAGQVYPLMGAVPKQGNLEYVFPSGATVRFAHLQHEKNKFDWQGAQLSRLAFDEVTHFTEDQFWYLLSRARTTIGVKPQVRATCNPDADSWVAKLIEWWIGEDGFPIKERSGVLRWFVRINNVFHWADEPDELIEQFPDSIPKSLTFIPARLEDNPILCEADPDYKANLLAQHPIEQARLLGGNWKAKFGEGLIFSREWFEVIDRIPAEGGYVTRFWDMAGTAKAMAKKTTYYTAGVKILKTPGGLYVVLDAVWAQIAAGKVAEFILSIAKQDGLSVRQRWELEGGSAGKIVESTLAEVLVGFNASAVKPMGDKVARAIPFGTEANNGNVKILRASWNDTYLNALRDFDGSPKPLVNDLTDSSSGAYADLKTIVIGKWGQSSASYS